MIPGPSRSVVINTIYKQVSSVNDADRLQSDLESLQQWEEQWLLKYQNVMF